jgi:hypothetical protein
MLGPTVTGAQDKMSLARYSLPASSHLLKQPWFSLCPNRRFLSHSTAQQPVSISLAAVRRKQADRHGSITHPPEGAAAGPSQGLGNLEGTRRVALVCQQLEMQYSSATTARQRGALTRPAPGSLPRGRRGIAGRVGPPYGCLSDTSGLCRVAA